MDGTPLQRLHRFFNARHIAVVGASAKNGWFANVLANAAWIEADTRFYPVNPGADEVCGVKAYRTIADLPAGVVDFAAILVKVEQVPDVLRQLKGRGIDNALLFSSGYGETGEEGRRRQRDVEAYCRREGMLVMGPNCLGYMNFPGRVSMFLGRAVEGDLRVGGVGVVGQSGATTEVLVTKLLKKRLGISLYATTGNEALLTVEDCLEYLVRDPGTKVIAGFFEGFRNVAKLQEVARAAARRRVPILMIKVGRSAKAVRAARSHTGALAGNDAVLDGILRQWGIVRVDTIEELVETAGLFVHCPLPRGTGFGIYTLSGGLCGVYADLCARYGIELPALGPATVDGLRAVLPDFARPDNPLDVTGGGFQQGMDRVMDLLMADESLHILAPLSVPPKGPDDAFANLINAAFLRYASTSDKPLVPILFREAGDYARAYYEERGLHVIEDPGLGFRAVAHLIAYARFVRGLASRAPTDEPAQ